MSTQELRLRYYLQLFSDIGPKAKKEAQEFSRSQDQMSRAAREADRSVKDLDRTIDKLASNTTVDRQARFFDRLAESVGRARDRARQLKDVMAQSAELVPRMASVAAGGAAGLYAANRLTAAPMAFDFQLRQAALTAYGDRGPAAVGRGVGALRSTVNESVRRFGGEREQALAGYRNLIGSGEFKADEAEQLVPVVQEVAVGAAADVNKIASLTMRLKGVMKIAASEMRVALSRMDRVGQMGGVELDQQAGYIADLAGEYGAVGYEGQRGAVAASVDLQLAYKVAGSADSARTILSNFYGKTLSSDTARDFSKIKGRNGKPIDLYAEIAARRASSGGDGVEAFMSLADDVLSSSGGDGRIKAILAGANLTDPLQMQQASKSASDVFERAGLGSFIQDREAMRGFLALYKQRDERQRMISVAMSDTGQAMDTRSAVIQASPEIQKQKALAEAAIAAEAAFQAVVGPVNAVMKGAASLAQEFPQTAAGLAALSAAATVAAAAMGAVGLTSILTRGGGAAAGAGIAAAAPGLMSRLAGGSRFLGPGIAALAAGVESYDVLTDEKLTAMGKTKGVTAAVGGAAGAWGGAKLGMAAGSFFGPAGTVIGGLAGGALGYYGAKAGVNWLWGDNPERDFVKLSAPNGQALAAVPGGAQTTIDLGNGLLRVDVHLSSDGSVSTSSNLLQPMKLLRVESGSTDPGSFAALGGAR